MKATKSEQQGYKNKLRNQRNRAMIKCMYHLSTSINKECGNHTWMKAGKDNR